MTDPGASPSRCAQDRPETTAPSEATAAGAREALLRQSEERQRFMLALGDALRRESHAEAKIEVAARLLGEHLAASRVLWAEYDWDAGLAHIFNGWFADGAQPFPSVIPLADYDGEILGELCAGRIVRVADVGARAAEPAYRAIAALGVQALLSPPLLVDGRLKVNLSVHQHAPRHWTDAEVALVREAAERLWAEVLIARAEAALRASEAKYRDLFETMGQGYFYNEVVRDAAGRPVDLRHLDLNPAFERLTGKLLAESKGRTSKEVFGGLDEEWLRSADEVVRSGTPRRVEHFLTPVGRWFEAHFYPAGGDRFTGFYEDIHERKLAEAVLRESEERQAFLLAHSDAVRMLGDAAEIQSATSRLIVEHMGVDRAMYAEVEGPRGAEQGIVRGQYITGRGDGPRAIVPFAERFAYAQFGKHRMRARYRGELLVVADIEADPAADAAERANWKAAGVRAAVVAPLVKGGRLVAEFGVQSTAPREWTEAELTLVRDVAERTWAAAERARAEAALPESEERYRTLFESMDEAYAVVEVLRDETGKWADFRFIDVNPAFLQHTAMPWPVGKTATELLGSPNPRWAELYGEALDRGEAVRVEEDEPTLGRTFDLNIFALDRDRDRVAVLFTNVTERKQAEAALRKSEERFRLIVENARDYAIFTTDPAGTVTDWREGAGAVFGYPPAEIVGASCDILFTPEDAAFVGAKARRRPTADEMASMASSFGDRAASFTQDARRFMQNRLTDAMVGAGNYSALSLIPTRPLLTELAKGLANARRFVRIKDEMDALRNAWQGRSATVGEAWR
ncbi:MAG: PAS domain S-box protein, partial [Cypionkella sp.]